MVVFLLGAPLRFRDQPCTAVWEGIFWFWLRKYVGGFERCWRGHLGYNHFQCRLFYETDCGTCQIMLLFRDSRSMWQSVGLVLYCLWTKNCQMDVCFFVIERQTLASAQATFAFIGSQLEPYNNTSVYSSERPTPHSLHIKPTATHYQRHLCPLTYIEEEPHEGTYRLEHGLRQPLKRPHQEYMWSLKRSSMSNRAPLPPLTDIYQDQILPHILRIDKVYQEPALIRV